MKTHEILETLELADATLTAVANVFGGLTGPNGCDTLPARRSIWTAIVAVREALAVPENCDCPPPPPEVGWVCPCGGSCPG